MVSNYGLPWTLLDRWVWCFHAILTRSSWCIISLSWRSKFHELSTFVFSRSFMLNNTSTLGILSKTLPAGRQDPVLRLKQRVREGPWVCFNIRELLYVQSPFNLCRWVVPQSSPRGHDRSGIFNRKIFWKRATFQLHTLQSTWLTCHLAFKTELYQSLWSMSEWTGTALVYVTSQR